MKRINIDFLIQLRSPALALLDKVTNIQTTFCNDKALGIVEIDADLSAYLL